MWLGALWVATFGLMLDAGVAAASEPKFTTIDFPGAVLTSPYDINSEGDIVCTYVDAGNYMHSVLLRNGDFTTIDFPGSTMTHAYGINSPGDIVGEYRDAGNHWHGFMLHNDNFTQIDYPGSRLTQTWGINANRTITGSYVDSSGKNHAFVLDKRGAVTTLDPSFEFSAAYAHGLTPRTDTIVGCWYGGLIMHSLHSKKRRIRHK